MRFEGKVAFVTGGAGGIGAAAARSLSEGGAKVVITDRSGGDSLAEEIGGTFVSQDVTDEAGWTQIVTQVLERFGKIDVLVNCAGIEGNVMDSSPLCSYAEWKRVLAVNLDGTFLGTRAVLPSMMAQNYGSIINISSLAHYVGLAHTVPYAVSKSGVWNLSRAVAAYAASQGTKVRCNSVHPGMIDTRMLRDIGASMGKLKKQDAESESNKKGKPPFSMVPFGAPGTSGNVADVIAFLASDESTYVTGSEFRVDGGWGLWMS